MRSKLTTAIVLFAIALLFMFQNTAVVQVRMLFWQIGMPRYLLIFLTLLIGMLIGWLVRAWFRAFMRQ